MARDVTVLSADAAAELIRDGATLTVSSSSGLNCPDRVLQAIGERHARTGHPRDLTTIHPIAAGDMYGIPGVDHLARDGLLRRVIAGSYPSGPSNFESPKIWKMIIGEQIEAYNLPSGLLFDMHRDVAARRPGVITQVGLDTFVDPRRHGGRMNTRTRDELLRVVEFDGQEWLHLKNVPPDVAIIRGTTADEHGNISMEHEGAYLGVVDQALAARNNGGIVIAQVKRLTARGSIPPQRVHVPSTLVDYVVVVPDQKQTTQTDYDPAISGETRKRLSDFAPLGWSPDQIIARRAAMELRDGDAVNLGFGIAADVPRILMEQGRSERINWVIEQGAVGGIPLTGFAFGCAANADAILPSPQQFTYFQGGGFDCSLLSLMEVDASGSVNVSRLSVKPHVTAGCGGFVDISSHARKLVFCGYFRAGGLQLDVSDGALRIVQEGKVPKFVPEVEHVTFSGRMAARRGQDVTYVTERCVIRLREGQLVVTEVAPGVDLRRDVLERCKVELKVDRELSLMAGDCFAR
ncbi:MAG: acyl CoA:acetate/3-ketoacid CoA transferase [Burkholderiaceae bacterium]